MHPFLRPSLFLLSILPLPPTTSIPNIPSLMSKNNCKIFADLLHSSSDAADSFASNLASGITAFCPTDPALNPFLPRFKNLSADDKVSLLLYHAIPIYYSIQMLKSNNGVVNTLATDGIAKNFNFTVQNDGDDVTLQTKVSKAKIVDTIFDRDPVALYSIDAVLEPMDLFKPVAGPAPAPLEAADSPESEGEKGKGKGMLSPAASPSGKAVDQKVGDSSRGGVASEGGFVGGIVAVFALVFV